MSPHARRRLIALASTSPRRRELLALTGAMLTIAAAPVDETPGRGETPEAFVRRMSQAKAGAAARRLRPGFIIVAADTVVVSQGRIIGKPADVAEATAVLKALRGKPHQVMSAVTVTDTANGASLTDFAATDVPMRDYSDEEIAGYVASGDPLDKAGAYAIQHAGFHPVERLSGCYANVMGLPLCHLTRTLRGLGFEPPGDAPHGCRHLTGYHCPVYESILKGKP